MLVTDEVPSACGEPCTSGGGPCRNIDTGECAAYEVLSDGVTLTCRLNQEDCADLPNQYSYDKTAEENVEAGSVDYLNLAAKHLEDIGNKLVFAGACDSCNVVGTFGNCRLEVAPGLNYCLPYENEESETCGTGQTTCPKPERNKGGSTVLRDTSCVDPQSATNADPYRKCPASICTYGTEGFCYQPETGLCMDYMPGTYEQGTTEGDIVESVCYPNTVPCYYETNAQCDKCLGDTAGPCKQSVIFGEGAEGKLCFPTMADSARDDFRAAVESGDLTCADVPKARQCNEDMEPCGQIVRPLVPPQCGAHV